MILLHLCCEHTQSLNVLNDKLSAAFNRLAMVRVKRRVIFLLSVKLAFSLLGTPTGRRPAIHSTQIRWTG